MRARMAIYSAGIEVEQIEVSLKAKPQSLLDCSPKGTVPVVVTVNGEIIEQSRDIMLWALNQSDPGHWLAIKDQQKQQEMRQLVDCCDEEFKPLLDRYKYFDRHPEQSQNEYRKQAEFFLKKLDDKLSTHKFLIDEHMRFADAAIFPFIRQFAALDNIWFSESSYKNLQGWLQTCISSEIFLAVMQKSK